MVAASQSTSSDLNTRTKNAPMERKGVTKTRWSAYCVYLFTIWV